MNCHLRFNIDALTFISHGAEAGLALMEATTCACGPPGLTGELFEAIRAATMRNETQRRGGRGERR